MARRDCSPSRTGRQRGRLVGCGNVVSPLLSPASSSMRALLLRGAEPSPIHGLVALHFLLASQFPVFMAAISILKLFLFGRESYFIWKADSRVDAIIWNGMRITHDYIHGHQCQDMCRSLRAATGPDPHADPNYR